MKKGNIYSILTTAFIALINAIFVCACIDDTEFSLAGTGVNEYIGFSTSVINENTKVSTRSIGTNLNSEEKEWLYTTTTDTQGSTRGMPVTNVSDSVGLIGYKFPSDESMTESRTSWDLMTNRKFVLEGDELKAATNPIRWKEVGNDENLKVYAYSPYINTAITDTTITGIPSLNYTVDAEVAKQADLIVADTLVSPTEHGKNIPLTFNHILTAIQFRTHFDCKVVSITLNNIKNSSTYIFGKGWNEPTGNTSYKISFGDEGKEFKKDSLVTFGENTMMLLPQKLSDSATVVLEYYPDSSTTKKSISASLKDREWMPGKIITYTLHDKAKHNFLYFDLAAGNVDISTSTYKGYYYEDGVKKYTTGTHDTNNVYHVYQSTDANKDSTGLVKGKWRLPEYPEVMYKNKTWSKYITNNDSVEAVIHAWDNKGGTDGAAKKAGRTYTMNYIKVSGKLTCDLIIDNLYSRYQNAEASRTTGSICFLPTDYSKSTLTINFIGDNRLGSIHYYNKKESATNFDPYANNNRLILQGTGSLTVADADFKTVTAPGNNAKDDVRGGAGYYSNHWCSAIGNNDGNDDCRGIIINSGTIFAGTTAAENCTAIGGGGNGFGGVTINGGTVTAVASTTGTAIGGGIGFNSPGGVGHVEINGGNIYAYNHANRWNVPSSAIGGAGSKKSSGSRGTVIINGGNIYAQSALGTAIGGGSSYSTQGGDAYITIKNGKVVAKSVSARGGNGGPNSDIGKLLSGGAGIGGGSAATGGDTIIGHVYNGGTATITITGNPIIRTGSIGGGLTFAKYGKIGSAVINIHGGDIQAQFIMAAGSKGTPSFNMTDGIIRNSYINDAEYKHVRDYGGAVYLENGKFTMSGGKISNCRAQRGGAVYVVGENNPTFTMSGGTIEDCIAKGDSADGGAVYLEGGTVTVEKTAIINGNISDGGNGGGICVKQGNFVMSDGTIKRNNSLTDNGYGGNGGGVYISSTDSVYVTLSGGSITDNSASRKGGGVCVEMPRDDKDATVDIGIDDNISDTIPLITRNISLSQGGGLFVSGKKSVINIYDGDITGNSTTSYVANEDVANEQGTVTLKSGKVTHVTVTFDGNGGSIDNDGVTKTTIQNIVTATNSLLVTPKNFIRMGYTFTKWNTRKDGNGVTYTDGQLMNIKENITLYAQWEL